MKTTVQIKQVTIQNNSKKLILAGMYTNKVSPTGSLMAVARYWN